MSNDNRKPTALDRHIGANIRRARVAARLSQTDLAISLDKISFQAIQKWEQGQARISASRLWQVAKTTGKPIVFFFSGITPDVEAEMMPTIQRARTRRSRPKATASSRTGPPQQRLQS